MYDLGGSAVMFAATLLWANKLTHHPNPAHTPDEQEVDSYEEDREQV